MQGDKEDVADHIGVLVRGLAAYARKVGLIEVEKRLMLVAAATDKIKVGEAQEPVSKRPS